MKVIAFLALSALVLTGCGGQNIHSASTSIPRPDSGAAPRVTATTVPRLPDSGSPPPLRVVHDVTTAFVPAVDLVALVGKTMHFTSGNGCHTDISVSNPPQGVVAGRGGVNVVFNYSKDRPDCYWNVGITGAALQFVLHRNDDGESYRSTASLITFPQGCPFTFCIGRANPVEITFDIVDNISSIPQGYQIVPPSLSGDQHIVFDTSATSYGAFSLTFDNTIPPDAPLGDSTGALWRTDYRIEWLDQVGFHGWASISEQWESHCGHEKWYWANGVLLRVESPNDGINHDCTPMKTAYTMVLTSVT